ncbi:MAG: BatD family protein [Acidobacteria bacterium]|nr:BatD family protein [Acidobacteriota bacterium]
MRSTPFFLAAMFLLPVIAAEIVPGAYSANGEISAVARVDQETAVLGEEFHLTVEIRGALAAQAKPPDLFSLKDFRVLGYPGVQSRYQFINGRASFTKSFRYTLMPEQAGQFTIPPVTVQVGNLKVVTRKVEVRVVKGNGPGRPGRNNGSSGRDPRRAEVVRAVTELDKEEAFLGEQVTLKFLILTPKEIRGLELIDQPAFPGFWVEELPKSPDRDIRRVRRDGDSHIEYTVMKRALFASQTGELVIEPVIFAVTVPRLNSDSFRSFLFESRQTLHRRTDRRTVRILPLPTENRPEDFRGAVGQYRLTVSAQPHEVEVNDAITLRVTVQGNGNLSTLEAPILRTPDEIRRYDPQIDEEWSTKDTVLSGRKTWEYVLVPRVPGTHTIPPVRFSYFDPQKREYLTLKGNPLVLQVAKGDSTLFGRQFGSGHGALVAQGRDIHFIKSLGGRLRRQMDPLYQNRLIPLALIFPAIANGILLVSIRRKRHNEANRHLFRKRQAWSRARRELRNIEDRLGAGRPQFYSTLSRILNEYLSAKFDLSPSGFTREKVISLLADAGITIDLSRQLSDCLEACDEARFTGNSQTPSGKRELLDRSKQTLASLEERL